MKRTVCYCSSLISLLAATVAVLSVDGLSALHNVHVNIVVGHHHHHHGRPLPSACRFASRRTPFFFRRAETRIRNHNSDTSPNKGRVSEERTHQAVQKKDGDSASSSPTTPITEFVEPATTTMPNLTSEMLVEESSSSSSITAESSSLETSMNASLSSSSLSSPQNDGELSLWAARGLLLLVAAIWGTNFAVCSHNTCTIHESINRSKERPLQYYITKLPYLFGSLSQSFIFSFFKHTHTHTHTHTLYITVRQIPGESLFPPTL